MFYFTCDRSLSPGLQERTNIRHFCTLTSTWNDTKILRINLFRLANITQTWYFGFYSDYQVNLRTNFYTTVGAVFVSWLVTPECQMSDFKAKCTKFEAKMTTFNDPTLIWRPLSSEPHRCVATEQQPLTSNELQPMLHLLRIIKFIIPYRKNFERYLKVARARKS